MGSRQAPGGLWPAIASGYAWDPVRRFRPRENDAGTNRSSYVSDIASDSSSSKVDGKIRSRMPVDANGVRGVRGEGRATDRHRLAAVRAQHARVRPGPAVAEAGGHKVL